VTQSTRPTGRLVLATDLDGTFAHGTPAARTALVDRLAHDAGASLIYVTGRSPAAARSLASRLPLPEPDLLIADVGTSVLHALGPERVKPIEEELDLLWPGDEPVRQRLLAVPQLVSQEVAAPRRVSYWIEPVRRMTASGRGGGDPATAGGSVAVTATPTDPFAARSPDDPRLGAEAEAIAAEVAQRAAEHLEGLAVDVLVSANVFLDVLPRGVDKGSTLRRVLDWLDVADDACIVAGDSLNDLALFETGLRGIAVGNCEPALRRRIAGMQGIYQAAAHGADGVLEGMRFYGLLSDGSERDDHAR